MTFACVCAMATYEIPQNIGKVRVAMGTGGKYTVWNGKQGRGEFSIVCRDRKQDDEVAEMINKKKHSGEIEVLLG